MKLSRQGSLSERRRLNREGMSTADNIIQHEELGLAVWSTKVNCPINIVKYNKPKMLKGLRPKRLAVGCPLEFWGYTDISTAGGIDRT